MEPAQILNLALPLPVTTPRPRTAVSGFEASLGQVHLNSDRWPRALALWRLANSKVPQSQTSLFMEEYLWSDEGLKIFRLGKTTDEHYRLQFSPEISFDVECATRMIWSNADNRLPATTARHLLYDQILPRVIAHTGSLVLHAGAFQDRGCAILALGKSGRGKSTLVASFNQAGQALIGDDASVISWCNGRPHVSAVYPSLRLLPDSISALLPPDIQSSDVAHYSPKQRIDLLSGQDGQDISAPIVAQFVIGAPAISESITLRRLTIAQACMAIIENSFALNPTDPEGARERMVKASTLARSIATFEISYPRDYARLPEVRQTILDQVGELGTE